MMVLKTYSYLSRTWYDRKNISLNTFQLHRLSLAKCPSRQLLQDKYVIAQEIRLEKHTQINPLNLRWQKAANLLLAIFKKIARLTSIIKGCA